MGRFFYCTLVAGIVTIILLIGTATNREPGVEATPEPAQKAVDSHSDPILTDLSDYIWPTDAERIITSTFAEYRRFHFHGGIDISTGNSTGFKVYAARDGYVSRIRVSPVGYGKMLYVRHPDNHYTTYAHLERFSRLIEERVAKEQKGHGRYPVDIDCSAVDFPVRKGELIAYTGETGAGSPHLHFEIRDENLDFINPLLCENIVTPDSLHPTIRNISVTPLGENSLVNGHWAPTRFSARLVRSNIYTVAEPIRITGEVGFGVDVRDRSNGSRFVNGLYRHDLFIDDSLVYYVQLDRAPSNDAHQNGLYYDLRLLREGKGRFEKLYTDSPNNLRFYWPKARGAGIVRTDAYREGLHTFRIVSSDISGNRAELTGDLIINHPARFNIEPSAGGLKVVFSETTPAQPIVLLTKHFGNDSWNSQRILPEYEQRAVPLPPTTSDYDIVKVILENSWGTVSHPQFYFVRKPNGSAVRISLELQFEKEFIRVLLHSDGIITATPNMRVYEGASEQRVQFSPIDMSRYVATFRPLPSFHGSRRLLALAEVNGSLTEARHEFELYPIRAGHHGTISFDDGNIQILYDSASVLESVMMRIEKNPGDDAEVIYALHPEHTVLNKGLTVRMRTNTINTRQAIYSSQGRSWTMVSSVYDSLSGFLVGKLTRTLGEVALLVDDVPPSISRVNISRSSSRKPEISFRFGDNLSGVDYNELKMYIDAVPVIPEVDGEHRRAIFQVSEPLERGSHQLTIRLKDKIGNTAEVQRKFTVR